MLLADAEHRFTGGRTKVENGALWIGEPVRKFNSQILHPVILGNALANMFVEMRSDVFVKDPVACFCGDAVVGLDIGAHVSAAMSKGLP
jgi:hypothetical protein